MTDKLNPRLHDAMANAAQFGDKAQDILASFLEMMISVLDDNAKFKHDADHYRNKVEDLSQELTATKTALSNAEVDGAAKAKRIADLDTSMANVSGILRALQEERQQADHKISEALSVHVPARTASELRNGGVRAVALALEGPSAQQ